MYRLIWAMPSWLSFALFALFLDLIGLIIIPILLITKSYGPKYSHKFKHYYQGFPWLFYIWSNEEDGVLGSKQYAERYPAWSTLRRGFTWSAIRNSTNNLRFLPILSLQIDPKKIKYIGNLSQAVDYESKTSEYWYFCWHGPYSCYRTQYRRKDKLIEFWIGWKLWPADIHGVSQSVRRHGAGFAMQWREYTSISGTPYL